MCQSSFSNWACYKEGNNVKFVYSLQVIIRKYWVGTKILTLQKAWLRSPATFYINKMTYNNSFLLKCCLVTIASSSCTENCFTYILVTCVKLDPSNACMVFLNFCSVPSSSFISKSPKTELYPLMPMNFQSFTLQKLQLRTLSYEKLLLYTIQ